MIRRRTLLQAGVALTTLGGAGCLGLSGTEDDRGADDSSEDDDEDEDGSEERQTTTEPDEQTGQESGQQLRNRLQVVNATGTAIDSEAGTLSLVELVVKTAPGSAAIDLRNVVTQWVDNTGTYSIVHESASDTASVDATFATQAIEDEDDSIPVLNSPDDRALLQFDVGDSDGTPAQQFGDNLDEGATASMKLTTETGAASSVRLIVPESLSGVEAVQL